MELAPVGSYLRRSLSLATISLALGSAAAEAPAGQWTSIGPASEPTAHSLAVDPVSAATIYAGAVGVIWKTSDKGRSWVETPLTIPCEVRALVIDPIQTSTLYAGCIGALKSSDRGGTWTSILSGMKEGDVIPAVWALAIHPTAPSTLYAGTALGKVFKSLDNGLQWQPTGALPAGTREIRAIVIDPANPETVYAGSTRGGVFKSSNGGLT